MCWLVSDNGDWPCTCEGMSEGGCRGCVGRVCRKVCRSDGSTLCRTRMSEGSVGRPVGRVCRRVALGDRRAPPPSPNFRVTIKAARGHIYIYVCGLCTSRDQKLYPLLKFISTCVVYVTLERSGAIPTPQIHICMCGACNRKKKQVL